MNLPHWDAFSLLHRNNRVRTCSSISNAANAKWMQQNADLNAIIDNWITAYRNSKRHIHQSLVLWPYSISVAWRMTVPTGSAVLCYCTYSAPFLRRVNYFSDTSKHILFSICDVLKPCIWQALMAYLASSRLIACNHSFYPKINTKVYCLLHHRLEL